MRKINVWIVAAVALALVAGVALGGELMVKSKGSLGNYLTDSKGMTLYWFKSDSPGKSACSGACLKNWPQFYAAEVKPPKGVDAKDFGAITRDDGKKQTTFRGYPLYYFAGDAKPGDTNGQGKGGVWFVVDPAAFMMKKVPGY